MVSAGHMDILRIVRQWSTFEFLKQEEVYKLYTVYHEYSLDTKLTIVCYEIISVK